MEHLRDEIKIFMEKAFSGCTIWGDYDSDNVAWRFKITFQTTTHQFHIRPPQGVCIMEVGSTPDRVTVKAVLFVEDFKKYHAQKMMN